MRIGVSTACFYPMQTEHALEQAGRLGIREVEIFLNAPSELGKGFLTELRQIKDAYNISVLSIHPFSSGFEPFLFFTNYERRFQDSLDLYERFYEAACALGAGIVVLHGDRKDGLLEEREYFERFAKMHERAHAQGVLLAQENVERCRSRASGFIGRMREYLGGQVNFVLDLKQAVRSGEDPFAMLAAMGSALCHLHLSDHTPLQDCIPPGRGGFDFKKLFERLRQMEYSKGAVIELYRENYQNPQELCTAQAFLLQQSEKNILT